MGWRDASKHQESCHLQLAAGQRPGIEFSKGKGELHVTDVGKCETQQPSSTEAHGRKPLGRVELCPASFVSVPPTLAEL